MLKLLGQIPEFNNYFRKKKPSNVNAATVRYEISAGKKCLEFYYGERGPKRRMSVSDVVTLNLVRIFDRTADLKTFHKNAVEHYLSYFPTLTNYENFMKELLKI